MRAAFQWSSSLCHLPLGRRNSQMEPEDFIGVLDEKYLPDWAREKLMELTAPRQEEPAAGEMKLE